MIGLVSSLVFSRLISAVRIYAEHGEVGRMARPHPVVRIAAKLAEALGRRAYQANVIVFLVYEQQVLVAIEIFLHVGNVLAFHAFALFNLLS